MVEEVKQGKQVSQPSNLAGVAILCVAMMMTAHSIITPGINTLGEHFVGYDVTFISTVASLGIVLGTFAAGGIMGKVMSPKKLAILGNALCLVFGVLPVFFDNYWLLIVDRACFGFCMGLIYPIANTLIIGYYEGDKRSTMLGFVGMAMNISGICFTLIAGALVGMNWNLIFLTHLFFIIALVMSFFLPDGMGCYDQPEAEQAEDSEDEKLNVPVLVAFSIILLFVVMANTACMVEASVLLADKGIDSAFLSSVALMFYTIGGIIGGAIFGVIYKHLKRYTCMLGFVLTAAGFLLILYGPNFVVMTAGFALAGAAYIFVYSTFSDWIGRTNPASKVGSATSIVNAIMNIGGFLASFWIIALGYDLTAVYIADAVVSVIGAVIVLFYNPVKKYEETHA